MVAAVAALPGVDAVAVQEARRLSEPALTVHEVITFGPDEVAVLDDDPARPDRGRLDVRVHGAMSCAPVIPCGAAPPALGLVAPVPGQVPLRRRVGEFHAFVRDLIAHVESEPAAGDVLGRDWDVEGDPAGLHAGRPLGLRRRDRRRLLRADGGRGLSVDGVGLDRPAADRRSRRATSPRPPVAAQGWVRVEVDKGADPLIAAGTRVQAPGTPQRAAQTFEVAQDTQLRSDWNQLTATRVPISVQPDGRRVRFLGDPGFRIGDHVLFVQENPVGAPCGDPPDPGSSWDLGDWLALLEWITCVSLRGAPATALAIATVVGREDELGTALVEFDRDLDGILSIPAAVYAAYRVQETAGEARRLSEMLRVQAGVAATVDVTSDLYSLTVGAVDAAAGTLILDATLETLSRDQTVAIVDWASARCDVLPVTAHTPVSWEVTPGTPTRASQLAFDTTEAIATLSLAGEQPLTAYVVDRRVVARHYEFPEVATGATASQLRLYPAPEVSPERVAVRTTVGGTPTWEVLACRDAAVQETLDDGAGLTTAVGLIVDLVDGPPQGELVQAQASANLALVRHGTTAHAALGQR